MPRFGVRFSIATETAEVDRERAYRMFHNWLAEMKGSVHEVEMGNDIILEFVLDDFNVEDIEPLEEQE